MDIQTLLYNLHEEVSCSVCMTKFTDPKQLPCLHSFAFTVCKGFNKRAVFEKPFHVQSVGKTSESLETVILTLCRQTFESTVCWMCWPSKSAIQAALIAEIATKEAEKAPTASNVALFGAMTASVPTM